jgi:hypothetical protein
VVWHASFRDVPVHIMERECFTGLWSNDSQLGVIDFETGTNEVLWESPNRLGWPVRHGSAICVPWQAKGKVGVEWLDSHGARIRHGTWRHSGVQHTYPHGTAAGLAFQANDQTLCWLGDGNLPLWQFRAKPYIYKVHCYPGTDVFVATDGRGGHLFGLDPISGRQALDLKPVAGGLGDLSKVPGHDLLVATYWASRSYSVPTRLLVFSLKDRTYDLSHECGLIGTWEHGAICLAGANRERLAIVDIRSGGERR